ncbi:MAG: dihydrolipoyl dehydrogenase [Deltaproteobacteria bacterium]|nr:dihydrolipoyl dehydrogenase [Deltaproteobacteria bacterium]
MQYDVIVIGGGPGGYAASIRASQLGGKVALIEAAEIGGTCVNRGCIPSKVWLEAADLLKKIKSAHELGIKASVESLDLGAIVSRKSGVANDIRMGMGGLLGNNGVDVITGRAQLTGPGKVRVEDKTLEAKAVILATGSVLDIPSIPGLEEAAITTDQVFEMTEVPASVLIWGSAGPIEVEMASLLNDFGCKVHLISESRRILPMEDGDTSQRMAQALREQGVEILPRYSLAKVQKSDEGYDCFLEGPEAKIVSVERVLVSARKPNTARLGLEAVSVVLNDDGGIQIDDKLETTAKGIYAIGDATGGWMLSHAASSMAVVAAENALGGAKPYPHHLIARGIWTHPQVGSVGLSEEAAEDQGMDVEVGDFPYSINGLAMARGEMAGAVKVVTDPKFGAILGVHIVGQNATELVGEAVMAMQLEATVNEMANSIRVHPTFSESVVDAARDAKSWALYLPKR